MPRPTAETSSSELSRLKSKEPRGHDIHCNDYLQWRSMFKEQLRSLTEQAHLP